MKIRIVLFLLAISFSSFGQKVQFLDSIALNRVNPDEVEYVNLSAQGNLVIEGSSNVLLDISTMDIPAKGVDSVVISLDKKRYKTRALSPFLISNLNESVKVKVEAFSGSDTLSFISSKSKALELSVERRNKPTFTSDTIVFGLLALILALVFYTSHKQTKFWKTFYMIIPSLLLCYLIPAVLDLFGLISKDYSSLYTMAKDYLLPGALILMTLGIDFKGILNLGPKAIIMFLTATL